MSKPIGRLRIRNMIARVLAPPNARRVWVWGATKMRSTFIAGAVRRELDLCQSGTVTLLAHVGT